MAVLSQNRYRTAPDAQAPPCFFSLTPLPSSPGGVNKQVFNHVPCRRRLTRFFPLTELETKVIAAPRPVPTPRKIKQPPAHMEPKPQSPSEEQFGGSINESIQGPLSHSVESALCEKSFFAPYKKEHPNRIMTIEPKKRPIGPRDATSIPPTEGVTTAFATGLRWYSNSSSQCGHSNNPKALSCSSTSSQQ